MTSSTETGKRSLKKKGPPEFRHLPTERARKLKQIWVEKKRIKKQWRAQKRKEGLGVREPTGEHVDDDAQEDDALSGREIENKVIVVHPKVDDSISKDEKSDIEVISGERARAAHNSTNKRVVTPHEVGGSSRTQPILSRNGMKESVLDDNRSSRKPATHSSQTKNEILSRSKFGGHGRGGRGRVYDSKTGESSRRKSRQPDMRQKMGALIEKIQKTYST